MKKVSMILLLVFVVSIGMVFIDSSLSASQWNCHCADEVWASQKCEIYCADHYGCLYINLDEWSCTCVYNLCDCYYWMYCEDGARMRKAHATQCYDCSI